MISEQDRSGDGNRWRSLDIWPKQTVFASCAGGECEGGDRALENDSRIAGVETARSRLQRCKSLDETFLYG